MVLMDSLSNVTKSDWLKMKIQNEYSAHAHKSEPDRGLDPWRSPNGSRALGTRMK